MVFGLMAALVATFICFIIGIILISDAVRLYYYYTMKEVAVRVIGGSCLIAVAFVLVIMIISQLGCV